MKLPASFKIIMPVFVFCIVFAVLIAKLVVSSGEEAGEVYSVQTLSVEDQDVLTKHIIISTAPATDISEQDIPVIADEKMDDIIQIPEGHIPLWKKNAVDFIDNSDKPKIVIMFDDLGMSDKHTREVIDLPAPLTLSFLPYAKETPELAIKAHKAGHELMVHMPMEAMNPDMDLGSIYLTTSQSDDEFLDMLDKGLAAFDGYIGLNNHMGSRLTQDRDAMEKVMSVLVEKELIFIDSRTIHTSIGQDVAAEYGVPTAGRDVFLDHKSGEDFVRKSLRKTEEIARKYGYAIAIGHPKTDTINVLKLWLEDIEERGFVIVPVSALLKHQEQENLPPSQIVDQPDYDDEKVPLDR